MYNSSSPKFLSIDTTRQISSNYVKIGNNNNGLKQHQLTPKGSYKNEQNPFKSNVISRYSSQQDLQSHGRPKYSLEDVNNSPKNQHELMFKKNTFIPRKSNQILSKQVFSSQISQGKKNNLVISQFDHQKQFINKVSHNTNNLTHTNNYNLININNSNIYNTNNMTNSNHNINNLSNSNYSNTLSPNYSNNMTNNHNNNNNFLIQQKKLKHLKQTSSTSSTDNFGIGKSQKTIPSFLKNVVNKKKTQQIPLKKNSLNYNNNFNINKKYFQQHQLTIDNFQIIYKLGQGKFGSVFMAIQKHTGLLVALKIIQKKRVIQQNFLVQFIREIKIQAFLDHPNIAKVYGFFHDHQYFYSILQLGQGGQLFDIIKNGQTLSEQSTSFIIGNLLDAVTYLHSLKILHRDIKPQNIVLVHGNVKLCDFGWAVYKKGELRSTFCGTPLYLSPELLNGEKYDEKVDLWAIGILAFQLHIGSSPFNIQSQEDLLKIITDQIQYPENCFASKNFKQFISAVLRKDPRQRLQAKKLMELRFIKKYRQLQTCEQLCQ